MIRSCTLTLTPLPLARSLSPIFLLLSPSSSIFPFFPVFPLFLITFRPSHRHWRSPASAVPPLGSANSATSTIPSMH